jgi:hypothetical protein
MENFFSPHFREICNILFFKFSPDAIDEQQLQADVSAIGYMTGSPFPMVIVRNILRGGERLKQGEESISVCGRDDYNDEYP